ncbi:hypothetical protein TNCV_626601 [Trichonephila clavipes]|nr:hypothetical protein TNCV_626601 [Trichonephila clavipes]
MVMATPMVVNGIYVEPTLHCEVTFTMFVLFPAPVIIQIAHGRQRNLCHIQDPEQRGVFNVVNVNAKKSQLPESDDRKYGPYAIEDESSDIVKAFLKRDSIKNQFYENSPYVLKSSWHKRIQLKQRYQTRIIMSIFKWKDYSGANNHVFVSRNGETLDRQGRSRSSLTSPLREALTIFYIIRKWLIGHRYRDKVLDYCIPNVDFSQAVLSDSWLSRRVAAYLKQADYQQHFVSRRHDVEIFKKLVWGIVDPDAVWLALSSLAEIEVTTPRQAWGSSLMHIIPHGDTSSWSPMINTIYNSSKPPPS